MELQLLKVLVTGGTGFLGRHVCDALDARGADWAVAGRQSINLKNRQKTKDFVWDTNPDCIIHLAAACGGIGANMARPAEYLADNLRMGLNVLEACVGDSVKKLVLVGTACSYPANAPMPLREASLWDGYPEPTNAPYGLAKRLLIEAAKAYRAQYGLNVVTVIPANLYGPWDHFEGDNGHAIPMLIRKFEEAREGDRRVDVWGDGSASRDFLYVRDAAAGILAAVERLEDSEPVNLGTGTETTIAELVDMLGELGGYRPLVRYDASKPNGQARRALDTTRAESVLGWRATTTLSDGLGATLRWYREQRSGTRRPSAASC